MDSHVKKSTFCLSTFQKEHHPKWAHFKKSTFQKEHISKRTFFDYISKRAHSRKHYSGDNFLSHKSLICNSFILIVLVRTFSSAIAMGGGCGIAHSSLVHSAQWFLEGLKFGKKNWKIFVQKPANL